MRRVRERASEAMISGSVALALLLTGLTSTVASAVETDPSTGADSVLIFQAQDISVEINAGMATAINQCIVDASDGTVVESGNYCTQLATSGNFLETGDIVVSESSDVSVTVSGGAALAINACVNDAVDGVVQTQINACQQSANAQTTVLVESITVTASENVTVSIDGGTATAINTCIDTIENGTVEQQINACSQAATALIYVEVGDILIEDSQNVRIRIGGGKARSIVECVSDVLEGTVDTQQENCTYTVTEGKIVTVGTVTILASENVRIQIAGAIPQSLHGCIEQGVRGKGRGRGRHHGCRVAGEMRKKARDRGEPGKLLFWPKGT